MGQAKPNALTTGDGQGAYQNKIRAGFHAHSTASAAEIESALDFISPDMDRQSWVTVGMAIQSELGDGGLSLFDSWSAGGQTYKESDTRSAWRSFKPAGKTTISTLFHLAKEQGYKSSGTGYTPRPAEVARKGQQSHDKAMAFWSKGKFRHGAPIHHQQGPGARRLTGIWWHVSGPNV